MNNIFMFVLLDQWIRFFIFISDQRAKIGLILVSNLFTTYKASTLILNFYGENKKGAKNESIIVMLRLHVLRERSSKFSLLKQRVSVEESLQAQI